MVAPSPYDFTAPRLVFGDCGHYLGVSGARVTTRVLNFFTAPIPFLYLCVTESMTWWPWIPLLLSTTLYICAVLYSRRHPLYAQFENSSQLKIYRAWFNLPPEQREKIFLTPNALCKAEAAGSLDDIETSINELKLVEAARAKAEARLDSTARDVLESIRHAIETEREVLSEYKKLEA